MVDSDVLRPKLAAYAVSVGLTPLIPIPLLDDAVRGRLVRLMLAALGEEAGVNLGEETLEELARDPASGCGGAVTGCLVYPFKKLLRKLIFVLEWKRAVDLVTRTYVFGVLVASTLEEGWVPGPAEARRLREAAWETMDEVGTSPVHHAVEGALAGARGIFRGAADLLFRALGRKARPAAEEVDRALRQVRDEEEARLKPVVSRLSDALQRIPQDYFDRLRVTLAAKLLAEDGAEEESGPSGS